MRQASRGAWARPGAAYDNARADSVFATFTKELSHRNVYRDLPAARADIGNEINPFYRHSAATRRSASSAQPPSKRRINTNPEPHSRHNFGVHFLLPIPIAAGTTQAERRPSLETH